MRRVVSYLTAHGVKCININRHYQNLRSAGEARNGWHFNKSHGCTETWKKFLRSILKWQLTATVPWCWKKQAIEFGALHARSRSMAEQVLPAAVSETNLKDILW